jgi:hypothetical protein
MAVGFHSTLMLCISLLVHLRDTCLIVLVTLVDVFYSDSTYCDYLEHHSHAQEVPSGLSY